MILKDKMSCVYSLTLEVPTTAVAPRTGKIIRNGLSIFERGENLLQNTIFGMRS